MPPEKPVEAIEFKVDDLTIRDVIEAERAMKKYTGKDVVFSEMFAGGKPSGAALAAFVYAVKKRDDPEFSFDDALDVKIEQLSTAPEDPTEAAN
jgi:hypothetical protein